MTKAPSEAEVGDIAVSSRAEVVTLDSVPPEPVDWLWPGWLPAGKLVLVDGDPGTGKSTMTLDLAARLSTGTEWPDGAPSRPGESLLLSAEDGLRDTVVPRLDAAHADRSMIHALTGVPLKTKSGIEFVPPSFPRDIPYLAEEIRRFEAELVVIDPLTAFLGSEVDAYRDQDVRRVLHPLAQLAEDTGCTFILVRHLNKAVGGSALYRGGGSIGITGASRAAFLVATDPDDPELRVLAPVKFNLAAKPPAIAYRLVDDPNHGSARVQWESAPIDITADELVGSGRDRPSKNPAVEWLKQSLFHGPVSVKAIQQNATQEGISDSQLKRARSTLRAKATKEQVVGGGWILSLPDEGSRAPQHAEAEDEASPQSHKSSRTDTRRASEIGAAQEREWQHEGRST